MDEYPFKDIESKWRKWWESNKIHLVQLDDSTRPKLYVLVMFSYPSEKKLHTGHWWNYGGTDAFARFKRMQGYNVFEPMGFDAFGLPAENYAVIHHVHPAETTRDSVNYIREQLKQIGAMYDWSREVDTSQPDYYKWTQWLFLQLFKTGAAYRKDAPVNWCPHCQTVLANEQVQDDGTCERCDTRVSTRKLEQWFFRITDFADRLLEGLDEIDWPEATKAMQRHWIERSSKFSEIERLASDREKSGVFTGAYAVNPATEETIPVWIADYVLAGYGTGAVMAVPAHDQRDFEFSATYDLPVKWVIEPADSREAIKRDHAFEDYGVMHDSGQFNGLTSETGKGAVTKWLTSRQMGKATVSYRLRDWLISRQRYWGAPIPIVHCPKCGLVPVPEEDLPVLLPERNVDFTPRGTSPLGSCREFIETVCPQCGEPARRDPDTMDTFVCSSWYQLRYTSTEFHDRAFDPNRVERWLPVDVYVGGPEHATGHLIYARYITHYLNSIGLLKISEPFTKLIHQGIITHKGRRMSKSKGNVVNPDEFIENYGSDCFRLYLMFMGDFKTGGDWSDEGIIGIWRFQNRVWRLFNGWVDKLDDGKTNLNGVDPSLERALNYTIREVTNDLERFEFNTGISRLMELVNILYRYTADEDRVDRAFITKAMKTLALLLGPLAPHMAEELWHRLGHEDSLFNQSWPEWNEAAIHEDIVTVVVQVNGKLVDRLSVPKGTAEEVLVDEAKSSEKVLRRIEGRNIKKVIFVPDKVISLVV